jgi:hypothetical protein
MAAEEGTVTISVTQAHLDGAKPKSTYSCAAALAMADAGLTFPAVKLMTLTWVDARLEVRVALTPPEVRAFIHRFDRKGSRHLAKPFSFELEATP